MGISRAVLGELAALYATSAHAAPPAAAYGRLPSTQSAALSESGDKVAVLRAGGKGLELEVLQTNGHTRVGGASPPADMKLRAVGWSHDDHVLLTVSTTINPFNNQETLGSHITSLTPDRVGAYEYVRTLALSPDGGNSVALLDRADASWVTVEAAPPWPSPAADPDGVRMQSYFVVPSGELQMSLQRVSLSTGNGKVVALGGTSTASFILDGAGALVARVDTVEDRRVWRAFAKNPAGWKQIAEGRVTTGVHPFLRSTFEDGRLAMVMKPAESDRVGLYAMDRVSGEVSKVYESPTSDLDDVLRDPWTGEIVGYEVIENFHEQTFLDPQIDAVRTQLAAIFKNGRARIDNWDKQRDLFVVSGFLGPAPPKLYLFQPKEGRLTLLGETYPELDEKSVGERVSLTYKARDGVRIPAYLTLPGGDARKDLPLVIAPHGGPASRDSFEFDWFAAFLASRGYAVLQPNFRGSSGYGAKWEDAGWGQWGGIMQDDLSDGVAAMVKAGIADPKRVCIVGMSYGGYAALAGATLTPELYRCAASVGGISDMIELYDRERRRGDPTGAAMKDFKRDYGDPAADAARMRAVSPLEHVDRIAAPILLLHASADTIVPIEQSRELAEKLKAAGKTVRFVTLQDDDHWMSHAATRTLALSEIEAFLAQYLPPNPESSPK